MPDPVWNPHSELVALLREEKEAFQEDLLEKGMRFRQQYYGDWLAPLRGAVVKAKMPTLVFVPFEGVKQWLEDHGWSVEGAVDSGETKTLVIRGK